MSVQRIRLSKVLGMAMTDQGILIAEVAVSGDRRELVKAAEYSYPGGSPPADFTTLGRPLSAFLRQQGFGTRQAVIGLPARWVLVKACDLPPADAASAAKILSLQAETAFSIEARDLIFDFSGQPQKSRPSSVLLMGTGKPRLDQIQEMASQARLTVRAILPSVAALGAAVAGKQGEERLVVHIAARAVELAAYHGGELDRMRHIMMLTPDAQRSVQIPPELGTELRRTIASLPVNGTPPDQRTLMLWDERPRDDTARRAFSDRLGITVDTPSMEALGVTAQSRVDSARFASAAALAGIGLEAAAPPVNFSHSRMTPPRDKSSQRKIIWAAAIAAVLVLVLALLVVDMRKKQSDLAILIKKLNNEKTAVEDAGKNIARIKFADTWITHDQRYLNCWLGVLQALPANDYSGAFYTTFELQSAVITADKKPARPILKGQVSGKATNQKMVNDVSDAMRKNNKLFENVNVVDVRDAGAGSRQVAFTITFTFVGTE